MMVKSSIPRHNNLSQIFQLQILGYFLPVTILLILVRVLVGGNFRHIERICSWSRTLLPGHGVRLSYDYNMTQSLFHQVCARHLRNVIRR
jgi:hypothetical protein